jgi:hypothetical protein
MLVILSCKKTTTETAKCSGSYSSDIKPIANSKCALKDCHGSGSSLGDFTQYAELKLRADSGWIRRNVFELKIMPPASAVPLTEDEKQKLKCWLDNGAPLD